MRNLLSQFSVYFLDSGFYPTLKSQGWTSVRRWFADHSPRYCPSTSSRPLLSASSIALPCFIDNCHWVAVTHRVIADQVIFLYADDMNNLMVEQTVKQTLSSSDTTFFPESAKWTRCNNYTYLPHSNECGPRTLLALSAQALHPHPRCNILLPLMHPNLAQISRTWLAANLLNSSINFTLEYVNSCHPITFLQTNTTATSSRPI